MPAARVVVVLLIAVACLQAPLPDGRADDFDLPSLQSELLHAIDRVRPAVALISGRGSAFSGVIVSPQGHVLSVGHAVSPGAHYRLTLPDGRRLRGIGKGTNPRADAALILITDPPADLPFASMGDSGAVVTDQPCFGLSYPGGQRAGTEPIARFGRVVRSQPSRGMLQSSALMEPGDSGGPLFDLNGCVIGIHSRIGRSMDRNYEVPVNTYREFWNELNREQTFTQAGLPLPQLGVRIDRARRDEKDAAGLTIISVIDDSLAAKAAILPNDTLLQLYGRALRSTEDLREALIAARDEGAESITARLTRGEDEIKLEIAFDVDREAAPEVALPKNDRPSVPDPKGLRELGALATQLAELEDQLDDACVTIRSDLGETSRTITGTRFRDTPWIVSKSSAVGENPVVSDDDDSVSLTVIARDTTNDLVLLQAPEVQHTGAHLTEAAADLPMGTFVLTPDNDGAGIVSIVGSPAFRSQKQQSRGFLGVMPSTYRKNEGAILNQVNEDGAAQRAGLLVGDIITMLNDTVIRTQNDLRTFLAKADPDAVITATVSRDETQLTKTLTLGTVPQNSVHAADQMAKSGRRDGFGDVFPHDADLAPSDCGGPLFDTEGRFLGVNIARNSRARSYTLPASVLRAFLQQAADTPSE